MAQASWSLGLGVLASGAWVWESWRPTFYLYLEGPAHPEPGSCSPRVRKCPPLDKISPRIVVTGPWDQFSLSHLLHTPALCLPQERSPTLPWLF